MNEETISERERINKERGFIKFSKIVISLLVIALLITILIKLNVLSWQTSNEEYNPLDFGLNNTQQNHENILEDIPEDNFSNMSRLHWGHMPLTYKFENKNTERQTNLTRTAFSKIEEETSGVVSFKEVEENPDISIYFDPTSRYPYEDEYIVAEASISEFDKSRNLIIRGDLFFYEQGFVCNSGYPALEVHEILHLLDIPHNSLGSSVMSPYTAQTSKDCKVTRINIEYISCLKYIYSNGKIKNYPIMDGEIQEICYFPNHF